MLDQCPDESHFFAGVVEDDFGVRSVATEAVGRHDHRQVAGVHFGHGRHFGLRKDLEGGNAQKLNSTSDRDNLTEIPEGSG